MTKDEMINLLVKHQLDNHSIDDWNFEALLREGWIGFNDYTLEELQIAIREAEILSEDEEA